MPHSFGRSRLRIQRRRRSKMTIAVIAGVDPCETSHRFAASGLTKRFQGAQQLGLGG